MPVPGSGNYMVDADDNEPRHRLLECGCEDECHCDDEDEDDL